MKSRSVCSMTALRGGFPCAAPATGLAYTTASTAGPPALSRTLAEIELPAAGTGPSSSATVPRTVNALPQENRRAAMARCFHRWPLRCGSIVALRIDRELGIDLPDLIHGSALAIGEDVADLDREVAVVERLGSEGGTLGIGVLGGSADRQFNLALLLRELRPHFAQLRGSGIAAVQRSADPDQHGV